MCPGPDVPFPGLTMFEISISTRFSAAHHLQGYPGSCAEHHGHNWEVEVFVQGEQLGETGLLMDFRDLKKRVAETLAEIDHTDLNKADAFAEENPTSENIARFLYRRLSSALNGGGCRVGRVSVRETPETQAIYWEG